MTPVFGLYSHIRANRFRSVLLVAGLFFLVVLIGYAVALLMRASADVSGAPLETVMTAAAEDLVYFAPGLLVGTATWVLLSLGLNAKLVDMATGARTIERADDERLYEMLENLCISRGMTPPRLKIIDSPALNAYASGLTRKQYAITLTTGLVHTLDDAELEAVMAHELTHIRNEDVRLMMVAVVVAGVISFVGELAFRSMRFGRGGGSRRDGKGALVAILIAMAIIAIAWIFSLLIRFALSRAREYMADAGAVELTKNPDAMISALLKIQGRADLEGTPSTVMEMCVENPRRGMFALLATHPSIEDRVAALVRNAGGRVPLAPDAGAPPPDGIDGASSADGRDAAGPWGAPPPLPGSPAPGPWGMPPDRG